MGGFSREKAEFRQANGDGRANANREDAGDEREAWVFAYVFAPIPIVSATGSPGNPIAVP